MKIEKTETAQQSSTGHRKGIRLGIVNGSWAGGCILGALVLAGSCAGPRSGTGLWRAPASDGRGPWPQRRSWALVERAHDDREVKLTEDQRKAMDGILMDHRTRLIDLHANLEKAELDMEPLMSAEQPNDRRFWPRSTNLPRRGPNSKRPMPVSCWPFAASSRLTSGRLCRSTRRRTWIGADRVAKAAL